MRRQVARVLAWLAVEQFKQRFYRSPRQFWEEFRFLIGNRARIRAVMGQNLIQPAFRERLMMAVTAVNGCRYCSYFHAREALLTGISEAEVKTLLSGSVDHCPEEEAVAVLYAQHWAESDACPDPDARRRLVETYGSEKASAIELVLRMIRMGNLVGNTWDYFLYRISMGRWGLKV